MSFPFTKRRICYAPDGATTSSSKYRKISELPQAEQAYETDQFEINQSGITRSLSLAILKIAIGAVTGISGGVYDTPSAVADTIIPAPVLRIRTLGYEAANDEGGAEYSRASAAPTDHQLWFTDASGAYWEIASDPIPIKAAGAKGDGVKDFVADTWNGTSDVQAIKRWGDACVALGFGGHATPGAYLLDQGGVCHWDVTHGLKLTGETGRTTFVHQIGHPDGEIGFSSGITIGRMRTDNQTGGGAGIAANVNYVAPSDTGIVTMAAWKRGLSQTVQLNTLAIASVPGGPVGRQLQVGDYAAILDTQQLIPYRSGKAVNITSISQDYPCQVTAPGHTIDPDDPDGDVLQIVGVTGMVEINNGFYRMLASASDPDLLTLINLDSRPFSPYTGGGTVGTRGGISGYLGEVNRIIAVDTTNNTVTFQTPPDFDYLASTRIGVWHNPCTDFTWEGIDWAYDGQKSHKEGVVAAVHVMNCMNTRVAALNIDNATSRVFTFENCPYGTMDRVIGSFYPGIAANISGVGLASCWWNVSNCLMERGGHLCQIGAGFEGPATAYINCFGNQGVGCGSLLDTHWGARNITFRNNKVGTSQTVYEGITQKGSCFTIRGWGFNVIADNECYGHSEGIKWHCGGAMGGSMCYGNLLASCRIGMTLNNYDRIVVEGNRFVNCSNVGLDVYATSGPAQGYPIFSEMRIKRNTFIGPSSIAAFRLQTNQQPIPLRDWTIADQEISGNPAQDYLGAGDMAGQLQYYVGGKSTEPAFQAHAPWYPMSTTTGAVAATSDASSVVGKYRPGEIVALAGGTTGTLALSSGTYDPATGYIALVLSTGLTIAANNHVTLSGLTGTGTGPLNGTWQWISQSDTTHHTIQGPISQPPASITGGTATYLIDDNMAAVRVGNVTVQALALANPGHGYKVGDTFPLSGGTTVTVGDHIQITVTGIVPTITVDGVDYGPISTYTATLGIAYSALPGGDLFSSVAAFRTPPAGGAKKGLWRSVATYSINDVVGYKPDSNTYCSLINSNTNQPPATTIGTAWKLFPPTGFQSTFLITSTAPTGTPAIKDAGAYNTVPPNPVGQFSSTGTGTGIKFNVTWDTGMLDVGRSPKDLVLSNASGIISNLGTGRNIHRLIRVANDTTWQASANLIPPFIQSPYTGTYFTRAGWQGDWYADELGVWRCTSQLQAIADQISALQSTFPTAPGAGFVRDWYSADGRKQRQSSTGHNRFFENEDDRIYRATPQNGSRDFTNPPRSHAVASGTYNTLVGMGAFTGAYANANGQLTLTFPGGHGIMSTAQYVNLASLTGTGAFASANGTWPVLSITNSTVVVLQIPASLGALTITGGTASYANLIALTMSFASPINTGAWVTLSGLAGTGGFASLNGTWQAFSVSGTAVNLIGPNGAGASTVTGGTASVPQMTSYFATPTPVLIATTDAYAQTVRQLFTSGTANNAPFQIEMPHPVYLNKSGRIEISWGVDAAAPNHSYFVGLKPTGTYAAGFNPTALVNSIGVGVNANTGTLRQIHGDASAPSSATDLGSNFPSGTPASTQRIDIYTFTAWWGANPTTVFWQLVRNTQPGQAPATGVFTTEIPDANTPLYVGIWAQIANTATAIAFALVDAVTSVRN